MMLCNKNKLILIIFPLTFVSFKSVSLDYWFNPLLMSDDISSVADLSIFEKGQEILPGKYTVDIYVNNLYQYTKEIEFYFNEKIGEIEPCLSLDDVRQFSIEKSKIPENVDDLCFRLVDFISDSKININMGMQRLDISIPQAYMDNMARGYINPDLWDDGITAGILNYSYSGGNYKYKNDNSSSHFLNLRSGINFGPWRLRDYSTILYNSNTEGSKYKFTHLFATLGRDIKSIKSRVLIGDTTTSSDLFDSINFRGVVLSSESSMEPDSLRNYSPTVRGIAKSTAIVTIKQNGNIVYQETVPAGPFVIRDINSTNNGGDLNVSIQEADGSIQSFNVPWAALPNMQREGAYKYAINLGALRNNDYIQSKKFIQGEIFYGLFDTLTVSTGTQLSSNYTAFSLGGTKGLGQFGALSATVTDAKSKLENGSTHHGQKYSLSYQKNFTQLGTNFEVVGYRYSTSGFYEFDATNYKQDFSRDNIDEHSFYYDNYKEKGRFSINLSQDVNIGSLYLSLEDISYWDTNKKGRSYQAGFSSSYKGVSYSLSYSNNDNVWNQKKDEMISFNVSLPLSNFLTLSDTSIMRNAYVSNSFTSDLKGSMNNSLSLSGTALENDAISYNLTEGYVSNNSQKLIQSNISGTYFSPSFISGLGYSRNKDSSQLYYSLSGGILAHSEGITFSQPLNQTAILVKAKGAKNVAISGYRGVTIDDNGFAVIPYASNYRRNRVALNLNNLSDDVEIDNSVANVVPTNQAVSLVDFKSNIGYKAFIDVMFDNKPVPFGSVATIRGKNISSFIGDNGSLYITGLDKKGIIDVSWGKDEDQTCSFTYKIQINKNANFTAICKQESK